MAFRPKNEAPKSRGTVAAFSHRKHQSYKQASQWKGSYREMHAAMTLLSDVASDTGVCHGTCSRSPSPSLRKHALRQGRVHAPQARISPQAPSGTLPHRRSQCAPVPCAGMGCTLRLDSFRKGGFQFSSVQFSSGPHCPRVGRGSTRGRGAGQNFFRFGVGGIF